MPTVGINSLLLALDETYRSAGVSNYNAQLLRHVPAVAADLHLVAFAGDRRFTLAPGVEVRRPIWPTRPPLARIAWEQSALALASRRLDLLHGTVYASPLLAACPTVVTVHDLTFVHQAAALKRFNRLYLRLITRLSVRRAARVIAVSAHSRRELIDWLALPPDRGVTVPNGVSCLLYTSDAADARSRGDLGGRRVIKKKKKRRLQTRRASNTRSTHYK